MEKFLIVDGNSLINRAFYGLPPLKSLSGKLCNAIYGFLNSILSVITSEKPKYFACVFDAGKHTFRHDMYAEYKGKRDHMPEELFSQLNDLKSILKTMGVKVIEIPEIEADDIIGSLSRKYDAEFMLLSGDKDLLQLINEKTTVWLNRKGLNDILKVTPEVLKAEFSVEPYQIIELKSIMGDSSDNIPGVNGIGKVGAMKLIEQYKDLDNIYTHIEEITGSTKTKLIENKDMAYLSKKLATIKLDVDLDYDLSDFEFTLPLNSEVKEIFTELDFKSLLKREELFNGNHESKTVKNEIKANIIELSTNDELDEMIEFLGDEFACLTDEMSLHLSKNNVEYVLYFSGNLFNDNIEKLRKLFNSSKVIGFDIKALKHTLDDYEILFNSYFDVSLAIYIANETDAEISLQYALKLNNIDTVALASALYTLKEIYLDKLNQTKQLDLFEKIELPLVEVLFQMEKNGFSVDKSQILSLSESYHKELNELTKKIYSLAGVEFNINSPKQLQGILFDTLKIEYKGKKGTSVDVLNAIRQKHEIVDEILRYRKISKLISTYLDGMMNYISNDGKIHTTFMQRTTSTGRLSSREPNLQNLPIRDDEGRNLRKMFVSRFENGSIISADYNQIELRLMANFSGDENMISDYLSGKDIHSATASKIFNVSISEVDKSMRRVAKSVNFGIIYGISAYGLSQNIECSPKEAGEFINKYFEIYPSVKTYGENCIEKARKNGYAETIMGRIRHIPDINSQNHVVRGFAERVAKNMPLQGSASDIIKMAMIKVNDEMCKQNLKSKFILQIHDELVIDCYPNESEKVKKILKQSMENVISLKVPLLVEIEEGKTLFDAK